MTIARLAMCVVLPVLVAWWTYEAAMRSWRDAQAAPDGEPSPATDVERPAPGERWSWFLFRSGLPAFVVGVALAAIPVFGTFLQRVAVLVVLPMLVGGAIGLRRGAFRPRTSDDDAA